MRKHLRKIFPQASEEAVLRAVNLEGAEAELEKLKEDGIEVTVHGTIAEGDEPRINLRERFNPVRGVMGVLVRALFQKERDNLTKRCVEPGAAEGVRRDASRLFSCERGCRTLGGGDSFTSVTPFERC